MAQSDNDGENFGLGLARELRLDGGLTACCFVFGATFSSMPGLFDQGESPKGTEPQRLCLCCSTASVQIGMGIWKKSLAVSCSLEICHNPKEP